MTRLRRSRPAERYRVPVAAARAVGELGRRGPARVDPPVRAGDDGYAGAPRHRTPGPPVARVPVPRPPAAVPPPWPPPRAARDARRGAAHRARPSRRRWPAVLAAVAGAGCVAAGAVLLGAGPAAEVGTVPGGGRPAAATSGPADPDRGRSDAPAASGTASGPPDAAVAAGVVPVGLALPARGITAPVVPVRTGPRGALVVPERPSTVGWWAPSALAGGGTGPTVLAGHVDTAGDGVGALAALRDVTVGEPVVLRGADGREVGYEVVARRRYPKAELPPEIFAAGGPPGLVLVTCGGRFDPATRHYTDNVVVHAVPVGPS